MNDPRPTEEVSIGGEDIVRSAYAIRNMSDGDLVSMWLRARNSRAASSEARNKVIATMLDMRAVAMSSGRLVTLTGDACTDIINALHFAPEPRGEHGPMDRLFYGEHEYILASTATTQLMDLQRQLAEQRSSEPPAWQPIATAPMDGRRILLWWRTCKEPTSGRYEVDDMFDRRSPRWVSPAEGWRGCGDACIPRNQDDCTHWMPLPQPPTKVPK